MGCLGSQGKWFWLCLVKLGPICIDVETSLRNRDDSGGKKSATLPDSPFLSEGLEVSEFFASPPTNRWGLYLNPLHLSRLCDQQNRVEVMLLRNQRLTLPGSVNPLRILSLHRKSDNPETIVLEGSRETSSGQLCQPSSHAPWAPDLGVKPSGPPDQPFRPMNSTE